MISRALTFPFAAALLAAATVGQDPPAAAAAEPSPATAAQKIKTVRFAGAYADLAEQSADLGALLLGGGAPPKDFYSAIESLRAVGGDAEDKTPVFFDLSRGFALNQAQLAEVGRAIHDLRRGGRRAIAYFESAGSTAYQVAAMCDEIVMPEMGALDIPAPMLTTTFMRDALDLLGVQFDVVRCGDFKGAVEPYMLSSMSDHLRRHYLAMLDRMNAELVQRIADRRGMTTSRVRELQAQRIFTGKQALAAGLVDRLVPWIGAEAALSRVMDRDVELELVLGEKRRRKSFNLMSVLSEMFRAKEEEEIDASNVVVLHLAGGIVDGTDPSPGSIVSGPAVQLIERLAADDDVKGVVVRINSPGGSATASEAVRVALADLAEKKPLVYSMGRVAASGGYWITCIGRPILVEAGTITGSIGVFSMKPSLGALMRRVGVHDELVSLDDTAGMMTASRTWSDAEKARMQGFVDDIYDRFVHQVARSRQLPASEVLAIAGGRVWSGGQAVELGLVDRVGGLDAALSMVREQAKLAPEVEVRHLPRPRTFLDAFADSLMSVRALVPEGPARVALQRLGSMESVATILRDAFANDGACRVWALAPDLTIR